MKVIPLVWDEHTYEYKIIVREKNVKKKSLSLLNVFIISLDLCLLFYLLLFLIV